MERTHVILTQQRRKPINIGFTVGVQEGDDFTFSCRSSQQASPDEALSFPGPQDTNLWHPLHVLLQRNLQMLCREHARQIISITAGTLDIWNLNQEGLSSGDYRKAFFYLFKSPGRVTSGVSGAQLNRTWAKSSFLCSFCFNVLNTVYMKMMLLWLEALLSRRSSLCESPSRVSRGACRSCFDFLLVSRLAKPERTFDFDG